MTTLECIGTGSKGNCYILDCDGQKLILDAGVPIKEIKKALHWDISNVHAVLPTHRHGDHFLSVPTLDVMGVLVWMPRIAQNKEFEPRKSIKIGCFNVRYFPLRTKDGRWLHTNGDGSECENYGFIIKARYQTILYVTDFLMIPYSFRTWNITTMLIACNHNDDAEYDNEAKEYHSILGHSSLSVVKEFIEKNATQSLQNVILCHLSDSADADLMVREIESVVPPMTRVDVAEKGKRWTL